MAISVPNTISELEVMSKKLGLTIVGTKKDGSKSKEDYIVPIRKKLLSDKYGTNIPEYLTLVQNIKSPMLCKRIDELKEDLQGEIWKDDNWDFEEKIVGLRCFLIKDNKGIHILSRENSRTDLLPINMSEGMVLNLDIDKVTDNFIIDCELTEENQNTVFNLQKYGIMTTSNTEAISMLLTKMHPSLSRRIHSENNFRYVFNIFDCLYYNGQWITNETLKDRRVVLNGLIRQLSMSGIEVRLPEHSNTDKEQFYNRCLSYGLEGCVCKRLDGVYIPDTTRNSKGWMKVKRYDRPENEVGNESIDLGFVNGFCDTIDGFITGYIPGREGTLCEKLIYALQVSMFVDGEVKNVVVHNLEAKIRDSVTTLINNKPTLNTNYYHAVVELNPLGNMIINFRHDKSPQECILESSTYQAICSVNNY